MINDLINEFNQLNKTIQKLEKEKELIATKLAEHGYYVEKMVENEIVLGLFWKLKYYDYFIREYGVHTIQASGAKKVSKEQFKEIKTLLEEKKYNELSGQFEDLTKFPRYLFEEPLEYGNVTYKENFLHWKTTENGKDEGMMYANSYFEIRETTLKEIKEIPFKYKEDVPNE